MQTFLLNARRFEDAVVAPAEVDGARVAAVLVGDQRRVLAEVSARRLRMASIAAWLSGTSRLLDALLNLAHVASIPNKGSRLSGPLVTASCFLFR